MVWQTTFPDGTKSVKDNRVIGQANTTYITDNMDLDHFWNADGTKDGHHKQIQMPMQGSAGAPTDPTLAGAMDGVLYFKAKTAAESPSNRDIQPFYKNTSVVDLPATPAAQVMQLLGIRAMYQAVHPTGGTTLNPGYKFNIGTVVIAAVTFRFTVVFANPLPSASYLILGGGTSGNGLRVYFSPITITGSGISAVLTPIATTGFTFDIATGPNTPIDPTSVWFVCFGG